jgi:hypothetical protein
MSDTGLQALDLSDPETLKSLLCTDDESRAFEAQSRDVSEGTRLLLGLVFAQQMERTASAYLLLNFVLMYLGFRTLKVFVIESEFAPLKPELAGKINHARGLFRGEFSSLRNYSQWLKASQLMSSSALGLGFLSKFYSFFEACGIPDSALAHLSRAETFIDVLARGGKNQVEKATMFYGLDFAEGALGPTGPDKTGRILMLKRTPGGLSLAGSVKPVLEFPVGRAIDFEKEEVRSLLDDTNSFAGLVLDLRPTQFTQSIAVIRSLTEQLSDRARRLA